MANFATLLQTIAGNIYTNGRNEIDAADLKSVLNAMVEGLGQAGYIFKGVAQPSTNPGTPDTNVFYLAGVGTFTNFGGTTVDKGHIGVFAYNGSWSYQVLTTGAWFDSEVYPSEDALEITFYDSDDSDGVTIKINADVSELGNSKLEAISAWWAAQKERRINVIGGYTIDFDSLDASSPSSLGVFKAIQAGQIIDSYTNATSLIFGTDGGQSVTINKSQLPYTAAATLINVKSASGTLSNVSIKVRGSLENMPSYININEIANHPTAYADAATALADVPEIYRRKGTKVVYYDDDTQTWIEMLCCDDAGGANWWTDVNNNWAIEGPIETKLATATGGQQLQIAGEKRGNLDDVLNVNVWNEQIYEYESKADARAAVPANKRKLGGVITYLIDGMWYTEQFIGSSTSTWTTTESDWKVLGPVSVSQNTLSIGGEEVGELGGQLAESPEWVKVVTDSEGKILYGVKTDGNFYFGKGCPPQVQEYVQNIIDGLSLDEYEDIVTFLGNLIDGDTLATLLNAKLDKEGLDADALGTIQEVENPEYIQVIIDNEDKILEGIKSNGEKQIDLPINTPSFAIKHTENPEWIYVIVDSNRKILAGITRNGELRISDGIFTKELNVEKKTIVKDLHISGEETYDEIPTQIKDYVDESIELQEQTLNYLQLSRQSDNIINIVGYESFLDKTMVAVAPDKYSSWSRLGVVGDTLICMYCRGLEHGDIDKGQLYVTLSANGIIWTPKKLAIDTPNVRDGVTGGGNDEDGNMLFIDRLGFPGNVSTYHEIYRTTDGISYEKIATLPSSVNLGHCGDIVNIPTRGLMSFFGCYGSQAADYGYILSNDNGVTWSRIVIENVVREERPMEMSAAYLGNGKILVVGRYEGNGESHMWQLQSEDYGVTWTKEATNISGNSNTPSIIYDNETQMVSLYIYNRSNGQLEYRECAIGDIWDNPTNWATPTILAYGAAGQDAGNVTTCVFKGHQIVSWYSGNAVDTGIYNLIKS